MADNLLNGAFINRLQFTVHVAHGVTRIYCLILTDGLPIVLGLRGRWQDVRGGRGGGVRQNKKWRPQRKFLLRYHDVIRAIFQVAMMMMSQPSPPLQFSQVTCSCEIPSLATVNLVARCCIVK